MKKFKRKVPLISPIKIAILALCAAAAAAIALIFSRTWFIISAAVFVCLMICELFVIIGASGCYRYTDKGIEVRILPLLYKPLDASWLHTAVISNTSYNNGYGYGINGNIPMQYRVKGIGRDTKIAFPFITLHKSSYPLDKIKTGMNSRELFMLDSEDIYCLGICFFDSLKELLKRTECSVYVTKDVYSRFREAFDLAFSAHKERVYILTDSCVAYREYIQKAPKQA